MLKKRIVFLFLFLSIISIAQKVDDSFENKVDSLKKSNDFSEYIYVHLDEFVSNPSVENLSIFEKALTNLWRSPENKKEQTAVLYLHINYAFYLKELGFLNQSINHYEKAYDIYKTATIPNYNIIEFCLKPLANNYTRLGDVDRAEDILKVTIEKAKNEGDKAQIVAGYSNLAVVLRTKGKYKTAINYLELALNLSDDMQVRSRIHADLAINFLFLNDFQRVIENSELSTNLNDQKDLTISTRNSTTLGNCYEKKKQFEIAQIEFEKALKTAKVAFGENDREVAKIYNQLAGVYQQKNNLDKALYFYQKSLKTLLPKYNPSTLKENPTSSYFYPENTLKEALDGRARTFVLINEHENALKNYELSFKVDTELRAAYLSQNAKLLQQQESRNRSEYCIDLCYQLYQETSNTNWIEKAFQFAEQSKSIVLLEAKETWNSNATFKTDSLFSIQDQLLFRKSQLNKSVVLEELKGENARINVLSKLIEDRAEVVGKLNLLRQQIHLKYPHLKVQGDSLVSIKKIKDKLLSKNELLVEFFDGKKNVYVFSISKEENIILHKIVKDTLFKKQLSEFLDLFTEKRGVALQNNVQQYTSLGVQLYRELFKIKFPKNTIIVPDGLYSFLPFDALITEETKNTNFKNLPYLLHKTTINYAYSAAILMQETTETSINKNDVIGFFPIFKNNYRGLAELDFTLQEAEGIQRELNGTYLLGDKASKIKFNQQAQNYSIIHLSTHASSGDFYTPPSIEFFDETLYLPEIYGYKLNTDLLILSACETGLGTLRKGEGAMSLARGFSYAGVKNLIVSLWKVNDKSTEELMVGFYKNYQKNGNKSSALHTSKLEYINNESVIASKKSPYYWASFVYIGETTNVHNEFFNFDWIFLIGFLLIAGYFVFKNGKFGIKL